MPALSRSFQSVSLNAFNSSAFLESCVAALKSGTAMRTFSTPSPVPVRIQSWEKADVRTTNGRRRIRNRVIKIPSDPNTKNQELLAIFCNRTKTQLKPYFQGNRRVADQKCQCAARRELLTDRATVRHSIAQPRRGWDARHE